MTKSPIQEEVYQDLIAVGNEVGYLWHYHDIFSKTIAVMNNNPRVLELGGDFYHWVVNSYIEAGSVAVRRQLDRDTRTVSLRNVLRKLEQNQTSFTKDDFQRSIAFSPDSHFHKPALWQDAGNEFDRLFGNGGPYLDQRIIQTDITLLETESAAIREQVNKEIAHTDRSGMKGPKATGTIFEKCLNHLDEMTVKYLYLVSGRNAGSLRGQFAYDFEEVFTFPWLERQPAAVAGEAPTT
jgi:AbiU2